MHLKRKYSSSPRGSNKKIWSEVKWAEKRQEQISFLWQDAPINSRGAFFMLQCLSTYPIILRKQCNYSMLALTLVLNKTYSCHVYAFLSAIFGEACQYFQKVSLLWQFEYILISIKFMFILLIFCYIPTALTLPLQHQMLNIYINVKYISITCTVTLKMSHVIHRWLLLCVPLM